jgi:DHA1 family tetracycline resistance protein-like MFS transporter
MPQPMRRKLILVFGFVFIELLGYSLVLPLLPYYAETFGATLPLVGLLGTVNASSQLIAAPVVGRLSDRYGRRPLLILSIVGTFVSFLLLGLAGSLALIFVSRVLDGLFGGNIALARAYITDVTDEESRARALGIIGAAFGLGFIIGPAMGGLLSRYGYHIPALVAAGLSLLNLFAVILWLPESLSAEARERMSNSPRTAFSVRALWEALHQPCCADLLQITLVYSLAFALFQANFALWAKTRMNLDAQGTSYVLTYVGMLAVLVQGAAIGRLTSRFRERSLILAASLILAVALAGWAGTSSLVFLLIVLAPIALAGGVLNTVLPSQLTKAVRPEEIGGILGLSTSLQTFAQIVAPGTGGVLLDRVGTSAPGALASLLMVWATWLVWQRLATQRGTESPGTGPEGQLATEPSETRH